MPSGVVVDEDEAGLARRDDRDLTDPEADERVDSRERAVRLAPTVVREAVDSLGGAGARLDGAGWLTADEAEEKVTAADDAGECWTGDVGGDVAVLLRGGRRARGESRVAAMAASESVRVLRDRDGEAVRPRSDDVPLPLLLLAGPRRGRPVAALRSSEGLDGAAIGTSCRLSHGSVLPVQVRCASHLS